MGGQRERAKLLLWVTRLVGHNLGQRLSLASYLLQNTLSLGVKLCVAGGRGGENWHSPLRNLTGATKGGNEFDANV